MKVHTKFLLSALAPGQFPPAQLPEIAFLGRSNVGKSSLINSLVGAKIARTSNTPGRTQAINFFELRWPGHAKPEMVFADLPGYGYARVPREIARTWPHFIEPYLAQRRALLVVATKSDRVGSRLQASLNALKRAHGVDLVLPYSAKSGLGQSELWKHLRTACAAAGSEGEIA